MKKQRQFKNADANERRKTKRLPKSWQDANEQGLIQPGAGNQHLGVQK